MLKSIFRQYHQYFYFTNAYNNRKYNNRYSITFSEACIIHQGSQFLGKRAQHGYSVTQLMQIKERLCSKYRIQAKIFDLSQRLPKQVQKMNEAAVLYLPNIVDKFLGQGAADKLYEQQQSVQYDTKYFHSKLNKVVDKQHRHNIVFGDLAQKRSDDYKKYSIKSFKQLPLLPKFRMLLRQNFGQKANQLYAEGKKYFSQNSGIGFHGDEGRKIVVGLNLGKSSILRYCWRAPHSTDQPYEPIDILVHHGDIYVMCEKHLEMIGEIQKHIDQCMPRDQFNSQIIGRQQINLTIEMITLLQF